jgi:ammonia channel protein AmtB
MSARLLLSLYRALSRYVMNLLLSLHVVAGVCGMIAMAIFAQLHSDLSGRSFTLAYSFGLVVAAWLLNLVAAILLLVDSRNISYRSASDAARRGGAGMI